MSDPASTRVVEALKAKMNEVGVSSGPDSFSWGMLGQCRVLRRGKQGAFVLTMDEGELRFTYEMRNGKPYFTQVKIKPAG